MKQITGFLLAFSILTQAFVPTLWVLDYQWRRTVYLQHCENKNKTEMHCDGKCYLKKRIIANPGNDTKAPRLPDNFFSIRDLNLYCDSVPAFSLPDAACDSYLLLPSYYWWRLPEPPVFPVFKPPAQA